LPNLLFTDYCNRNCPYCFAKEKLSQDPTAQHQLSFANLVTVLDFLDGSGAKHLNILGGEPTLHPRFAHFLRYVLGRHFLVNVFTNGVMAPPVLAEIGAVLADFAPSSQELCLVINLNEGHLRSAEEDASQRRVMASLKQNASLSFNIFRADHDFSFLLETIARYELTSHLRLGLAQPIVGRQNLGLPVADYPRVVEQVLALAAECDKQGIKIIMDCGFPLCLFSDAQIGALFRCDAQLNFTCGPPIDIGPDLKVWFCFPLSATKSVLLTQFSDLEALVKHLTGMFQPELEQKGLYDKCASCKFLERRQCSGGCISHYLERDIAQIG
jgi:hypothetical protein